MLKRRVSMAISTGYTYGIRDNLVKNGVNSSDIGYDKNSGYVTVKGANAIKAPKNYLGTSYTTQQDFNNDWGAYQKSISQPNPTATGAMLGVGTGAATSVMGSPDTTTKQPSPSSSPYGSSNPYDTQVNDMIKMLMQQANNPQPVDANAIYNSPQWAAYNAQAQKGAQQGTRAAQEAMGSSGFGRSTALQERSQGIQNDATQYMNTQVLPQLMAQEQASRQQQLQNQFSALDALLGQQQVGDNRFNTANNLALDKGQLMGNYLDPAAAKLIDEITQLGESWKTGTAEQKAQFSQQADRNRAQLAAMGVDPSLFGADKTTEQRLANVGKAGIRTLGGQAQDYSQEADQRDFDYKVEYTAGRDKVADERWQLEFDRILKQDGIQEALAWAQNSISQQNANTSSASQGNAASNASFNKAMDIWKATGVAPDGIPGVAKGTPYSSGSSSSGKPLPYDQNPSWAQEISSLNSDPDGSYDDYLANSADYIAEYGYDGYSKLLAQAKSLAGR